MWLMPDLHSIQIAPAWTWWTRLTSKRRTGPYAPLASLVWEGHGAAGDCPMPLDAAISQPAPTSHGITVHRTESHHDDGLGGCGIHRCAEDRRAG